MVVLQTIIDSLFAPPAVLASFASLLLPGERLAGGTTDACARPTVAQPSTIGSPTSSGLIDTDTAGNQAQHEGGRSMGSTSSGSCGFQGHRVVIAWPGYGILFFWQAGELSSLLIDHLTCRVPAASWGAARVRNLLTLAPPCMRLHACM